ncbi:GIY-YIG nuclease family protein [Lactococcus lactis]|uniref:GIY-YIG nuclease family protein n=1 Tax=Lactococcus lactis TaxID=1358 RepID=UPI003C6DB269
MGVTRRLTPTDRVDELSSASVPFKFSINALVFSDNAFELESRLHKHFDSYRVNKFNNRKEYFKVSLTNIKEYLNNDKSLNVEWNEQPENFEYAQTLLIEEQQSKRLL